MQNSEANRTCVPSPAPPATPATHNISHDFIQSFHSASSSCCVQDARIICRDAVALRPPAKDMNDQIVLSLDQIGGLIESALKRGGMSDANVRPVAATMLSCERDGVRSHGLLRLPGFVRSM